MIKGIIFDFDGVIAESVTVKTDAFAELYSQYSDDIIKHVVDHHIANGGMSRYKKIKYYHNNFLKKPITKIELENLADKFSKIVLKKVIQAPYVPGIYKFINDNFSKYKLFISTGTPEEEIKIICQLRDIEKFFLGIYGSPDSKISHIDKIMTKNKLKSKDLLFFGDSNTDYDAAKKRNIKFILRQHDENIKFFKDYKGLKFSTFNNNIQKDLEML